MQLHTNILAAVLQVTKKKYRLIPELRESIINTFTTISTYCTLCFLYKMKGEIASFCLFTLPHVTSPKYKAQG